MGNMRRSRVQVSCAIWLAARGLGPPLIGQSLMKQKSISVVCKRRDTQEMLKSLSDDERRKLVVEVSDFGLRTYLSRVDSAGCFLKSVVKIGSRCPV